MDNAKVKAADILTESLKLIVTIATIFFGGLLAYHANLEKPILLWAYYLALASFAIASAVSVANINALINKIFRGEEDAIKKKDVKGLNIIASLMLIAGMIFGAIFLSYQSSIKEASISDNNTRISDSEIIVGNSITANIRVVKGSDGRITEVIITPKEANTRLDPTGSKPGAALR